MAAIAHHEAGHAFTAHKAGRVIDVVSISPTPNENGDYGGCRHFNPLHGQDIPTGDARLAEMGSWELIISFAGPEAEKRVDPKRKVPASDLETQKRILSAILNATDDERREYVRDRRRITRQIVADGGPAIRKIAEALLERGRLTGDEVMQIVSET